MGYNLIAVKLGVGEPIEMLQPASFVAQLPAIPGYSAQG